MKFLRWLFGSCKHPEMVKEFDRPGHDGLWLVCSDCGYSTPAILRTPTERADFAALRDYRKQHGANVKPFRRRA